MDATKYFSSLVAVAVSGGADSLYSLIRLQEQGVELIALHGVFFTPAGRSEKEQKELMRERLADSCRRLGITLVVEDFSGPFLQQVIRPFVEAYARGETPNPCALCNARIKFGLLQKAALLRGARFFATGHYACLERKGEECSDARPALVQGVDCRKEQSYFLALTPERALARTIFPLGGVCKQDVLETLARRGLSPPQPGESQEVCFVPDDEYRTYLPGMAEKLGTVLPGPGPMLLRNGQRLGTHQGLWRYTEGQRRGLGIAWKEPLHVLGKENENNVLWLGPRDAMRAEGCLCTDVNILLPPEKWPARTLVKTRYREKPKPARVEIAASPEDASPSMRIQFCEPENAVAPGQVAAVYIPWGEKAGDGHEQARLRLVAGGIIARAE